MQKPTRRELIKLDLLRGLDENLVKLKHNTTSNTIKECKIELKNSNSLMKIDIKR
jgi:hypothetical protein